MSEQPAEEEWILLRLDENWISQSPWTFQTNSILQKLLQLFMYFKNQNNAEKNMYKFPDLKYILNLNLMYQFISTCMTNLILPGSSEWDTHKPHWLLILLNLCKDSIKKGMESWKERGKKINVMIIYIKERTRNKGPSISNMSSVFLGESALTKLFQVASRYMRHEK